MVIIKRFYIKLIISLLIALIPFGFSVKAQITTTMKNKLYKKQQGPANIKIYDHIASILDKGTPGQKEYFTGTVFANIGVTPKDGLEALIGKVTFSAKARTNWHTHPTGQILIVTSGIGYYQEKGKPVQVIREGDIVKIPVNVEHWHGASHENEMVHLAIVPGNPEVGTHWMKPVTDQQYDTAGK